MDKLKPCPFCGNKKPKMEEMYGGCHQIICYDLTCLATMRNHKESDLIASWNRRAKI